MTNTGGDIEVGDYLQSSDVPGHAEKQPDDILHNHTARVIASPLLRAKQSLKKLISVEIASGKERPRNDNERIACTYPCGVGNF